MALGAEEDAEVVSSNAGLVPLDADAETTVEILTTDMACAIKCKETVREDDLQLGWSDVAVISFDSVPTPLILMLVHHYHFMFLPMLMIQIATA